MNEKTKRIELLESAPVPRALVQLAVPAILASLVTTIYNIVDTFFIGRLNNTAMIAATSVTLPIMMIIHAFGESVGVSAGSYISRELGAGRKEQVSKIVHTMMTMCLIASIVLPIFFFIFLDPLLSVFGADSEVIIYAREYIIILLFSAFTIIFKLASIHLLRAEGDVQFPVIAIAVGVISNVILDPIFMFDWGLGMGVVGAALATAIAQFISMLLMLWRLCRKANYVRWNPTQLMLDISVVKRILSLGSAVFARQALPSISYSCLSISAGRYGVDFLAAVGLAKKGLNLVMFAIIGFAQGFQPFAAYNYGAEKVDRLRESIRLAFKWVTIYGCIAAVFYLVFASNIIRIFTPDMKVVEIGKMMLYGYAFSMPIVGLYNVSAVLLQALGESKKAFFLSIARQGIYYIPIILILPLLLGPWGIYSAQPIADYLTVFTVVILCRSTFEELRIFKWKEK